MAASLLGALEARQADCVSRGAIVQFYAQPKRLPQYSRRHRVVFALDAFQLPGFSGDDIEAVVRGARVQLMLRGDYVVMDSPPSDTPANIFEATTSSPCILNEVRVRAFDSRTTTNQRHVPPFDVYCEGANGNWSHLCQNDAYTGESMEVRVFCLSNVPLRRSVPAGDAALRAALASLPHGLVCAECDARGDRDLIYWRARIALETSSKLKNFLLRGDSGAKLKQWPGKDAVQGLAVFWMAALLDAEYKYTEPELYALIGDLSANPGQSCDYAIVRKEMVRRGLLEPPDIVTNEDNTTTTYYRASRSGLEAALKAAVG